MSKQFNETSSSDYTPSDPKQRTDFMTLFAPRSAPESELARYRILSDTAGVRVSPLCLGAMSLGDQWTGFMAGKLDQKESEEYLDEFVKLGGNFIDTANNYQDEQSEHIIGEWMEKRGNRDDIVLATKYTSYGKTREGSTYPYAGVNQVGNAKKNLKNTVEQSLKRLRTSYLDILYVHWWDHSTSIPELMQSLNDLVRSGKVLYLGISDTPAWVVSQANEYARQKGFAQFVVFQGLWNLSVRDMERDIIPMCRNNGMALAPWGVLGQGKFKTEKELKDRATLRGGSQPTETDLKTSRILQEVADEIGGNVHLAHVAMAWVRSKYSAVYPIIGGTSLEQLRSNAEALKITLTPEQVKKLDDASPFDHGFPTGRFGTDPRLLPEQAPQVPLITVAGHVKYPKWA